MPDLDLTKAIEAGARALEEEDGAFVDPLDRQAFVERCGTILTAALPHILEALARQADDEWFRGVGGEGAYKATDWLRAKAQEVRQ